MAARDVVVLSDQPAATGGRRVVYLLPDNRRIPVILTSQEYSAETVKQIGQVLAEGKPRAPQGSLTETARNRGRG